MTNYLPEGSGSPSTNELSRQLRDVLVRVTEVTAKLETQFVRKEIFDLTVEGLKSRLEGIDRSVGSLEGKVISPDRYTALEKRVGELEDSNRWLMRLVITFVVTGVLAAVISFSPVSIG